jgi:hypothetical protein
MRPSTSRRQADAKSTPSGRPQAQLISAIQANAHEMDPILQGYELRRRGSCVCCPSRRSSDPGGAARAPVHGQIAGQTAGQTAWSVLQVQL